MTFILDSIKEKFKTGDKYSGENAEGFPDMNYVVGNTSGLAVGNIPVPLARRVGDQAQIGGSVMEVQIYNPASFSLEKHELINSINQLGIDITLHSDPNLGFASAYKTQGQQAAGYETVHDYFTRYLQELAKFKKEVETRDDVDFHIGRINPHASTSPLPALQERMPLDVGLDPFGYTMSEYTKSPRPGSGKNIFKNPEFLKRFYHTFILHEVDEEYQIYQLFSRFSGKFRDEYWREAQAEACNQFWDAVEDDYEDSLMEKIAMIQSARMGDQGLDTEWLDIIDSEGELESKIEFPDELVEFLQQPQLRQLPIDIPQLPQEINTVADLNSLPGINIQSIQTLAQAIHNLENTSLRDQLEQILENLPIDVPDEVQESTGEISDQKIQNSAKIGIENALDRLWIGNGDKFKVSVEAKIRALTNHLDIQQQQILELAQGVNGGLEDAAQTVMSGGDPDYFPKEGAEDKSPEKKHVDMIEALMNSFEQPMWMDSNLFYYIIPCWMSVANQAQNKDHKGWEAPEFIWDTLIMEKWDDDHLDDDEDGYDIDLADPDKENGYFEALENEREFMLDVAGAVSACYIWAHFTQKKESGNFDTGSEWLDFDEDEEEEIEEEGWTWIEWMNRHGIGVNLEAMHGGPQQLLKTWRPKDIVIAARAINLTARNRLEKDEELGGMEEMHEQLDGCIAKFTIDMEHVASFGVDPWEEMEHLIEQEKDLAEQDDYELEADEDKPLAKMLRQYHLMKPGLEDQQGTRHGPFARGDKFLYTWLYDLVKAGFARNPEEAAALMYEQAEEKAETTYMARITMNMIELGITPEELDPSKVDPAKDEYRDEKEALMARFFGMDKPSYDREWAKIEQHAFDPLKGLLEAEEFDFTWSSRAAVENDNRPAEWNEEEYR